MASALKANAGQAIRASARRAWVMACTSGWFWELVPSRLNMNAIASSRSTCTPAFARYSTMSAYSAKTFGLVQFGQRALVRVRHGAVGKGVEVVLVVPAPGPGLDGPLVVARNVIDYQVQYQADPRRAQLSGKSA